MKKIDAIIRDADQFWLAILLCFLCSILGMLLIGPWYLIRLLQWNAMANQEPRLLAQDVLPGSIAFRFQRAKIKLIIGFVVGMILTLFAGLLTFFVMIVVGAA